MAYYAIGIVWICQPGQHFPHKYCLQSCLLVIACCTQYRQCVCTIINCFKASLHPHSCSHHSTGSSPQSLGSLIDIQAQCSQESAAVLQCCSRTGSCSAGCCCLAAGVCRCWYSAHGRCGHHDTWVVTRTTVHALQYPCFPSLSPSDCHGHYWPCTGSWLAACWCL